MDELLEALHEAHVEATRVAEHTDQAADWDVVAELEECLELARRTIH